MASTVASDVGQAVPIADATRSVTRQALATATHATRSIESIVCEHIQRSQEDTSKVVDDIIHRLATEFTMATSESVEQSEMCNHGMVDTLRDKLRAKFTEDHATDEARRGKLEMRVSTLGSSIEGLQKQMNELNILDVTLLANMEQSLQRQIAESTNDSHVGIGQLSKLLDE